ncbi:hypothetical protein MTR_2g102705 [Medicago truncatula]|uniref:Uncharacterized protein n=1 Tax=Medicago truncatula TaxID=3880 RepID=A0A072VC22_MEDTR|nr:hypothetical protein MTR_2g102705 [Medicago truncatula]
MVEGLEEWSMFLDRSMKESDLEEGISSGVPLVRLLESNIEKYQCCEISLAAKSFFNLSRVNWMFHGSRTSSRGVYKEVELPSSLGWMHLRFVVRFSMDFDNGDEKVLQQKLREVRL